MIFNLTVRHMTLVMKERNVTSLSLDARQRLHRLVRKFDEQIQSEEAEILCYDLAKAMADLLDQEYQEVYEHTPELVVNKPKHVIIDRDLKARDHIKTALEKDGWKVEYFPAEIFKEA